MLKWTYLKIKQKVKADLDLEDEDLVGDAEMLGYANEAIDDAEAEIHDIYEDYFLTSSPLSLVLGTSAYSLPEDIYANKIRRIVYSDGSNIYEVRHLRGSRKFLAPYDANNSDYYCYDLKNSSADGVQLVLSPAAQETTDSRMVVDYIRNAKTLVEDSDQCDIPEFVNFIMAHMKVNVAKKSNPQLLADLKDEKERLRSLMIDTLTNMVPDDDNMVEMDLTHYWEHS